MPSNRYINLLFCAGAAILFCWIAFYNGFPLIYSDTGTYLESGFTLETPLDRPITYGFLIRIFSFNGSAIWTVILAQSFILSTVIWLIVRDFWEHVRQQRIIFSAIIAVTTVVTGVSIVASELIADIFTPITLFTFFLLVFGRKITRGERIALNVLFLFSVACHISHIIITMALLTLIVAVRYLRFRKNKPVFASGKAMILIFAFSALGYLTMMSSISKSRHVFMMGHLVETGILNAYLDDHCSTEEISLCKYRDRIPPGAETFIWNSDGDSVLILTGGWLGTKEEYSRIISETFTTGRYLKMHVASAVSGTIRQLYHIRCNEGLGKYDTTMLVSQRLKKYFPNQYSDYLNSRQSADEFAASPMQEIINIIFVSIGLLCALAWLFFRKSLGETFRLKIFILIIISGYFINAAICASLATVANRFSSRLAWLAVLMGILVIAEWLHYRRQQIKGKN